MRKRCVHPKDTDPFKTEENPPPQCDVDTPQPPYPDWAPFTPPNITVEDVTPALNATALVFVPKCNKTDCTAPKCPDSMQKTKRSSELESRQPGVVPGPRCNAAFYDPRKLFRTRFSMFDAASRLLCVGERDQRGVDEKNGWMDEPTNRSAQSEIH